MAKTTADFVPLLNDSTYHDITLVCEDGSIGACRAILAVKSPFFRDILYKKYQNTVKIFVLKNILNHPIKKNVLADVLHFLHTGVLSSIPASLQTAIEVYQAANLFDLQKLADRVLNLIQFRVITIKEATTLLNNVMNLQLPKEPKIKLCTIFLKPFCAQELEIGELNDLSEKSLELLLKQTHLKTDTFSTAEADLLLCIVDWAWAFDEQTSFDKRHTQLKDLKKRWELSVEQDTSVKIQLSIQSSAKLLNMLQHVNLLLICPHYLKSLMNVVNVFAASNHFHLAFQHYACVLTKCERGHLSGFRGKPLVEWDRSQLGDAIVVSKDGTVVELPRNHFALQRKVYVTKISNSCAIDTDSLRRWNMVIESTGVYMGRPVVIMGLVGKTFKQPNGLLDLKAPSSWWLESNGRKSITHPDGKLYGKALVAGDVVTFHLDMKNRTCSLFVNGKGRGVVWQNLPDKVYPAVSFWNEGKYRFEAKFDQ